MLILALDTTTRAGSLALTRDGNLLEVLVGDGERTHATRLPGDILDCLFRHALTLGDVDMYGVAVGPGSFTGLRIGIATVQGLAFAHNRLIVGVSALDALVEAAGETPLHDGGTGELRAAWMDAQRGEVYARLYRREDTAWMPVAAPTVSRPKEVLGSWRPHVEGKSVVFVGDGALTYASELEQALGAGVCIVRPVPPLAPAIAASAARGALAGLAVSPAGVKPLYVRRPDAELTRERRAGRTP